MAYVPGATSAGDVLAIMSGSTLRIIRIGAANYTPVDPTLSGSFSAGMTFTTFVGFGLDWASDLGKLVLWQNTTNRTEISALTPTDVNDYTQPWTRGTLTVSGSNAVTPPSESSGTGIFGRFGYSSKLKGCYLIPGTAEDVYFFATGTL